MSRKRIQSALAKTLHSVACRHEEDTAPRTDDFHAFAFVVSGCHKKHVFKFVRDGGHCVCSSVSDETFGASYDYLLARLFSMETMIAGGSNRGDADSCEDHEH